MIEDDDQKLFRDFIGTVEPLLIDPVIVSETKKVVTPGMQVRRIAAQADKERNTNFLSSPENIKPVKPWDELSFKRDGVQHGVFKKLRQGKYPCDVQLDLHRMTVERSAKLVIEFIQDCMLNDIRCGLITHGKGENRETPALLKSCINHWLKEIDEVLAFHSAQRHHGGFGATYILLRKSSVKRQENKERFNKKGG